NGRSPMPRMQSPTGPCPRVCLVQQHCTTLLFPAANTRAPGGYRYSTKLLVRDTSLIILAQIVLILAVLVYAVAPQAASATLQPAIGWLIRYKRPISIAVALIFGFYFAWNGTKGLLT